eukprot:TRINITY_DN946_c0_g2_i1.p1 TRINITY_DN946_c0_g2~~TRINITY_DN946_c0_g2_i1.p1  ORF type:complete len:487 (+),score=91.26 TRINITY_DN946_c0_g2_i1:96-1556(+)
MTTLLFDNGIEKSLDQLFDNVAFRTGLLLGQVQQNKFLTYSICPTPPKEGTEQKQNKLDEVWIREHAHQVSRMLCGGVYVIGIFIFAPKQVLETLSLSVQHVLRLIYEFQKRFYANAEQFSFLSCRRKIMTLISSDRTTYINRVYEFSETLTVNQENVQHKFVALDDFVTYESNWNVDIWIPIFQDQRIEKPIKDYIHTECERIWNALGSNSGNIISESPDKPDKNTKGSKAKKKKKTTPSRQSGSNIIRDIILYDRSSIEVAHENQNLIVGEVRLSGVMCSKAFLSSGARLLDGLEAIKMDLMVSLRVRLELLLEELDRQEKLEKQDNPNSVLYNPFTKSNSTQISQKTWCLPLRAFIPQNNNIRYCDYYMPQESLSDCAERFSELFGFVPDTKSIETVEILPEKSLFDPEQDILCSKKSIARVSTSVPTLPDPVSVPSILDASRSGDGTRNVFSNWLLVGCVVVVAVSVCWFLLLKCFLPRTLR